MKSISKRIGILFVWISILIACGKANVFADVIVEPQDNFYEEHREECEYISRTYIVNSKEGYVYLFVSPESKKVLGSIENNTEVFIQFIYEGENEVTWGVVMDTSLFKESRAKTAWINLSDCYVKYDQISFLEDHEEELVQEEISFDFSNSSKEVILWTYPQSGEIAGRIDPTSEYAQSSERTYDNYYLDSNNEKWIQINYYMGQKGWVCVTDPSNEKIEEVTSENKEPESIHPTLNEDVPKQFQYEIIVAFILSISLVVITAVVIHKIYKKEIK